MRNALKLKNVSRHPLCVQGRTSGIHLMPGEVREVEEDELSAPQALSFIKQGLLQVVQAPLKTAGKATKEVGQKSGNEQPSSNEKETTNG